MEAQEYERLSDALSRGHTVSVRTADGRRRITRQADLDALAGGVPQDAPSPRELRQAELGKLNKAQLSERATQLDLPTDGTKDEIAASILQMEFPAGE